MWGEELAKGWCRVMLSALPSLGARAPSALLSRVSPAAAVPGQDAGGWEHTQFRVCLKTAPPRLSPGPYKGSKGNNFQPKWG